MRTASEPSRASQPRTDGPSPYDDLEAPVLGRLVTAPVRGTSAESAPKKKKKAGAKKKKRKSAENGDALDKRVIGAVIAVGLCCVAVAGFLFYDAFLKPHSIVGSWAGSMIEFETGKPIIHTQYQLVLDDKNHASMTLQEKFTSEGTYTLQGNILTMTLHEKLDDNDRKALKMAKAEAAENAEGVEKSEDGEAVEKANAEEEKEIERAFTLERKYRVAVSRATLDLFDPSSGKRVVQLLRSRAKPVVGGPRPDARGSDRSRGGGQCQGRSGRRSAAHPDRVLGEGRRLPAPSSQGMEVRYGRSFRQHLFVGHVDRKLGQGSGHR